MNWKEEAAEKLRRYDAMQQAVRNIPEELQRLELAARAIRGAGVEDTPVKKSNSRQEEKILNNIVQRQELCWALENAQSWLKTANQAMSVLTPEEKLILTRLYIYPERGAIDRLCQELGIEQSSVYRRRDRALHSFTVALYGAAES